MLTCMRTTLDLPDGLMEAARARAAEEGRTLTSLIEEGLRAMLADRAGHPPVQLSAYGTGTGTLLVELDDREALAEALDSGA